MDDNTCMECDEPCTKENCSICKAEERMKKEGMI